MPRGRTINVEKHQEIVDLWSEGKGIGAVARELGVSRQYISQVLHRHDIIPNERRLRLAGERKERRSAEIHARSNAKANRKRRWAWLVGELWDLGTSIEIIATVMQIKRSSVPDKLSKLRKKYGVKVIPYRNKGWERIKEDDIWE